MFEGRASASGLGIVAVALVALVAFTALLYVRGASGPPLPIAGAIGGPTPAPTVPPTPSPSPLASTSPSSASSSPVGSVAPTAGSSTQPSSTGSDEPTASPTPRPSASPKPTATPKPSPTARPTPRPSRTPRPSPSSSAAAFQLPANPQSASASLDNGQGNCAGFPAGGVVITTSFRIPTAGQLTATSPLGQVLSGRISANGTFSLGGQSPEESWSGRLTASGGSGSYSVVSNGCTESYATTITFT